MGIWASNAQTQAPPTSGSGAHRSSYVRSTPCGPAGASQGLRALGVPGGTLPLRGHGSYSLKPTESARLGQVKVAPTAAEVIDGEGLVGVGFSGYFGARGALTSNINRNDFNTKSTPSWASRGSAVGRRAPSATARDGGASRSSSLPRLAHRSLSFPPARSNFEWDVRRRRVSRGGLSWRSWRRFTVGFRADALAAPPAPSPPSPPPSPAQSRRRLGDGSGGWRRCGRAVRHPPPPPITRRGAAAPPSRLPAPWPSRRRPSRASSSPSGAVFPTVVDGGVTTPPWPPRRSRRRLGGGH